MKCYCLIEPFPAEHIGDIGALRQYLRSEPWEGEHFPMRFLKDAFENDISGGALITIDRDDDYPMYLSDFDRVEWFFIMLAKRVQWLKLGAYGYCDEDDPTSSENAPPDYGGIFMFELRGDGSADSELTPF